MGKFIVTGSLDISQFWNEGKSDADTADIDIMPGKSSFTFVDDKGKKKDVTALMYSAVIKSTSSEPVEVIKAQNKKVQHITARFQGIDAPELHYKIYDVHTINKFKNNANFKKVNIEYRQKFSETAALALASLLKKYADKDGNVTCTFVTENISTPSDLCDVYGRFVGEIVLNDGTNLNHWLLENGHAMPSFYNSMLDKEIKKLVSAYNKAKKIAAKTALKNYSSAIFSYDFSLLFRNHGTPDAVADSGKFIYPKLFRRHTTFSILQKAGLMTDTFEEYLNAKSDDVCIIRKDLHEFNKLTEAQQKKFSGRKKFTEFIVNGKFIIDPKNFIVLEKAAALIDSKTKTELASF